MWELNRLYYIAHTVLAYNVLHAKIVYTVKHVNFLFLHHIHQCKVTYNVVQAYHNSQAQYKKISKYYNSAVNLLPT